MSLEAHLERCGCCCWLLLLQHRYYCAVAVGCWLAGGREAHLGRCGRWSRGAFGEMWLLLLAAAASGASNCRCVHGTLDQAKMLTVMLLQNFIASKYPIVQLLVYFSLLKWKHHTLSTTHWNMAWFGSAWHCPQTSFLLMMLKMFSDRSCHQKSVWLLIQKLINWITFSVEAASWISAHLLHQKRIWCKPL